MDFVCIFSKITMIGTSNLDIAVDAVRDHGDDENYPSLSIYCGSDTVVSNFTKLTH